MNIVEISRFERIKKKKKIFVATFSSSSNRRVVVHPDNCTNRLSVPPSVHERRGGERKGKEGVCVCKRCPTSIRPKIALAFQGNYVNREITT